MKNSLDNYIIDYDLVDKISIDKLKEYQIFPIEESEIFIFVASSIEYKDSNKVFNIFGKPVKFLHIDKKSLEFELHHIYFKKKLYNLAKLSISSFDEKELEHSHITLFCEELFQFAISLDASDIHIETLNDAVIIRFRIDGEMVQFLRVEWELYPILSSIIKLFASLDITLKRLPQDGRFSKVIDTKVYDFRVSTLPTLSGESIVLRILDNQKAYLKLDELGFDDDTYELLNKNIHLHNGMILITGATGSGKTTTIYSILNQLNDKKKKIISIEDPIEYNLDGVMQVNIDEDIGLGFHTVLKNILRQDPDILMIGEIRDAKSLKIAMQASLTGHLVFATLHTNDAIQTINRLLDLEAEPYLVASILRFILSQKLVRVLCEDCKIGYIKDGMKIYKANGCKKCNMTGYKGRTVITEFLEIDQDISTMITKQKDIKDIVSTINYKNINELLYEKVLSGITSLEEYYNYEI